MSKEPLKLVTTAFGRVILHPEWDYETHEVYADEMYCRDTDDE